MMIEFLYIFGILFTLWYFKTIYKVKPWNSNCCNRDFRYRIKKRSRVYQSMKESIYVIYRKYGCIPPWFIVKKDIKDAKTAATMLADLKEKDKRNSFKEKDEWLSEDEFLAEAL